MARNKFELANACWPILVNSASKADVIQYQALCKLLGYRAVTQAVRHALEPIQTLCLEKALPLLTSIVVGVGGKPGPGFKGGAKPLKEIQKDVFEFDWQQIPVPFTAGHREQVAGPTLTNNGNGSYEVSDFDAHINGRGPYQDRLRKELLKNYDGRCAL